MVVEFKKYKSRGNNKAGREEAEQTHPWSPLLAEFVGTLIFTMVTVGAVVIGAGTGQLQNADQFIPRGLIITALIYAFGAVSGAHFNPAVTLAFAVRGAFPWKQVPRYLLMQFLGAIAGAYLISITFDGAPVWHGPRGTLPQAFFFESMFAFVLITVVLSTSRQNKLIGHNAALAVGATIAMIGMLAGPISGGVVNPAKALGPAIVTTNLSDIWLYIVAPLVGAAVAAWLNFSLHGRVNEREQEAALGRHAVEGRTAMK